MDTKVYSQTGKETGKITLPESVFGVKWNGDLVHQVVMAMEANARTPVAHTKGRGEVAGGGKKPWKQKGTGRARHGSSRSPIWVGGGITHGPTKEKVYTQKINKKMRTKALYSVLSAKSRNGEILFVDTILLPAIKTAQARKVLAALSGVKGFETLLKKKTNAALVATSKKDDTVFKSFGNFNNIAIEETRNLNPVDVLRYKYLVIVGPEESISFLSGKTTAKNSVENKKSARSTRKNVNKKQADKPKS